MADTMPSTTETQQQLAPLDLTDYKEFLEFLESADECKCESRHLPTQGNPVCSYSVVAKSIPCPKAPYRPFLVCENYVKAWHANMLTATNCVHCGGNPFDCWNLISV